jgi:rubredoxin
VPWFAGPATRGRRFLVAVVRRGRVSVAGVWFLFHHNAKTRLVDGGDSFVESCPACGRRARFYEVEVSENFGVFFIDLVGDKQRKYRCGACGDVFDLRDQPDAPSAPPPVKSARELERERAAEQQRQLAAEQRRRAAEQRRHELAEAKANRIEDELAELKKRLGR